MLKRVSGDWGDRPLYKDKPPAQGWVRGRVKRLAQEFSIREVGDASEWEQFREEAGEIVRWEDFQAWQEKQGWDFVTAYRYSTPDGTPLYEAHRYQYRLMPSKKKFLLRHSVPDGWEFGAGPVRVPYRLPELIAGKGRPVVVCEGEKDADRAIKAGLRATSVQGQNWTDDATQFLAGEDVVIVPDNDEAGRENAEKAVEWLRKVGARTRVVELDGLAPRGDLYDWLEAGHTGEELLELASKVRADGIRATPAQWIDPTKIPPRRWLYRPFYIRQFVSVLTGAGGVGKSVLAMVEALSMATGKSLLGVEPAEKLKVWYWNGEDPIEELQRRLAAAQKHYGVAKEDMADRLFTDSGWAMPIIIGRQDKRQGVQIDRESAKQIIATIRENKIDVMIIDPFITAHRVNENDNVEVEAVVNVLKRIAQETNCAIMIVHYTRKVVGGGERTVDDSRGATALIAAARSARVTNTMSQKEANEAEIEERERRLYFRSDHGKTNLSRPPEAADWFKLVSVDLENAAEGTDWFESDEVGVVTPWQYPKADQPRIMPHDIDRALSRIRAGGPWRQDQRAIKEPWVGIPIAEVLGIDLGRGPNRKVVAGLVRDWLRSGYLESDVRQDDKRNARTYVVAGESASVMRATGAETELDPPEVLDL